jgi:hypothetical protein
MRQGRSHYPSNRPSTRHARGAWLPEAAAFLAHIKRKAEEIDARLEALERSRFQLSDEQKRQLARMREERERLAIPSWKRRPYGDAEDLAQRLEEAVRGAGRAAAAADEAAQKLAGARGVPGDRRSTGESGRWTCHYLCFPPLFPAALPASPWLLPEAPVSPAVLLPGSAAPAPGLPVSPGLLGAAVPRAS